MPLGDLAAERLPQNDLRAVLELGMLEVIKGGTTTLIEMFRMQQEVLFQVARDMGMRLYGAPYLFSTSKLTLGPDGVPRYEARDGDAQGLERWRAISALTRRGGRPPPRRARAARGGQLRSRPPARGPQGGERDGLPITIHLSQTKPEMDLIQRRHGTTPEEYLAGVGLLGPDLIVAHCIHSSDASLDLLKRTDTTIVSCPLTYARQGELRRSAASQDGASARPRHGRL